MATRGRRSQGGVSVSGPGYDRGGFISTMVGVSAALTAATRGEDGGTWYVREDGVTSHAIEKRGKTIQVLRMGGGDG